MTLYNGDCLDVMRGLADNSVDLVLTDPPYGLAFMGKKWDYDVPAVEVWVEALRVLKPGGYLLAFAGTRTQHRMACRIEDAGFEIRDMLAWVYGSGFPKSLDVSKAIDKAAGAEREVVGSYAVTRDFKGRDYIGSPSEATRVNITISATDAAREWAGYGTALKPALEPITMARKPLVGTVAANVLEYGTGALNIDACRVGTEDVYSYPNGAGGSSFTVGGGVDGTRTDTPNMHSSGRWPANLIHDGSDEVLAGFPMTKSVVRVSEDKDDPANTYSLGRTGTTPRGHSDSGSAARFFYTAKASKSERDAWCVGMERRPRPTMGSGIGGQPDQQVANNRNHHPTVKPIAIMEYLCKLASRPGAVVLDPFMGSGTTGIACKQLNREFIGIERDPEYFKIAETRINNAVCQTELFA